MSFLSSIWTCSCTIESRTKVNATHSKVCQFLEQEPERYLAIANVHIVEQTNREERKGEWRVSESVKIPFVPSTTYRIRWEALRAGAQWQSWAPFGVYVKNTFSIDGKETNSSSSYSILRETATLTSPVFLYPIVKPAFVRAHDQIGKAIEAHFAKQDELATRDEDDECVKLQK